MEGLPKTAKKHQKMTIQSPQPAHGVQKWWRKHILFLILVGAILFLASGKLTWGMAWAYLACLAAIVIANAVVMDPSLLVERGQLQAGTKKWDVVLASFVAIWGPGLIWLIAGGDIRFGWTTGLTWKLQIGALVLVVVGGLLVTWAMATNQYFSATVRIQTERNQHVVNQGPYQFLRHPGYTGGILSMIMTPLALGSWVALIPGILVASGYIVRTHLEDRVLQNELAGYEEYTHKVRYRLVPGIW
jgi:protein-S-isoprenylcysteine O-methyltransferase Ste14